MEDRGETIKNSLKLAWKNKFLWIFALLVTVASVNFNFQSFTNSFRNKEKETDYEFNLPVENMQNSGVLGIVSERLAYDPIIDSPETTSPEYPSQTWITESSSAETAEFNPFASRISPESFKDAFWGDLKETMGIGQTTLNSIIPAFVVMTVAGFILSLLAIAIKLLVASWSWGGLLTGINKAIEGQTYTLRELGTAGRTTTKEMIKYSVFSAIVRFLTTLLTVGLVIVSIGTFTIRAINQEEANVGLNILLMLMMFVGFISTFVISLVLQYVRILGIRFVTLRNHKFLEAFKKSLKITFKKIFGFLATSIMNCFVLLGLFIVMGLVIGLVVGLVILIGTGLEKAGMESLGAVLMGVLAVPIGLSLVVGVTACGGFITTYLETVWTYVFREVENILGENPKVEPEPNLPEKEEKGENGTNE